MVVYKGSLQGQDRRVDMADSDSKVQVVVFYPGDGLAASTALLASFSALTDQFTACHAALYGCSTDCVSSHMHCVPGPAFPLLSDPNGGLADRFGLYDDETRECRAGVVMLDSQGKQLEVISSSLEPDHLAAYCLDLAWKVAKHQDFKACNLSNYVADVAQELRSGLLGSVTSRKVSASTYREASRSRFLKRDPTARARAKSCDQERELAKRQERLIRGYF